MTRLINAVLLVFLIPLPALGWRVTQVKTVSLESEIAEGGKKDIVQSAEKISLHLENLDLQAGGLYEAAGAQDAATKTLMQEVQKVHSPVKKVDSHNMLQAKTLMQKVDAHNMLQATGDAMAEFLRALKAVTSSVYADAKAAARAEFYKSVDLGSGNARESKKEADAAAATVIDAETMLFEKAELLTAEALGKETLVAYILEGYSEEMTVMRVLERLTLQVAVLEIEIVKSRLNPNDMIALGKLQSGLSALEGQVEATQGQELDGEEIDLTKPLLWEASGVWRGIVKMLPDFLKVKLNVLRKLVENDATDQGKVVKGISLPPQMKKQIALDKFCSAVDNMEQRFETEAIIKHAIEQFAKAEVSTRAACRFAKDKLSQAVKATMKTLEIFDPEMRERQKAKINKAVKEKKRALACVPH